jgi:hypothetical protein
MVAEITSTTFLWKMPLESIYLENQEEKMRKQVNDPKKTGVQGQGYRQK